MTILFGTSDPSVDQYRDTGRIVRDDEIWAKNLEQRFSLEPLIQLGERVIVRKAMHVEDFLVGNTARCTHCQAGDTQGIKNRVSAVYKQSGDTRCSVCFNTGYDPPFDTTTYVLHAIMTDTQDKIDLGRSGITSETRPQAQFGWYPILREFDLVIRVNKWATDLTTPLEEEQRYQTGIVTRHTVRSGKRNSQESDMLVGQATALYNLPKDHILYQVPVIAIPPIPPQISDVYLDSYEDYY